MPGPFLSLCLATKRLVEIDLALELNGGYGAAGSALAWHARGQGFKSPYLHL